MIEIKLKENDKIFYHINFNYIKHQNFEWKLHQKTINHLKKCQFGKRISSKIFNNMWTIQLFPNGDSKGYEGKIIVLLTLCTFPLNVSSIRVQWNLSIKELNFKRTKTAKYIIGKDGVWMEPGSFKQFKECNNMTIKIDALILNEFDQNDKEITISSSESSWNKYLENNERKDNDNNDNKQILRAQFESYQHEMADKLSIYDAKINSLSSNIHKLIKSNQEKDEKIQSLTDELNEEITAKEAEINNNKQRIKALTNDLHHYQQQLVTKTKAIKSIKNTLNNNKLQTHQNTSSLNNKIQQIEQQSASLNDRITQILEEERKDNNDNDNNNKDILNEINKLKEEINQIKSNKIGSNVPLSGLDKLRSFFEIELNFSEYVEPIIQNGFEDMQSLNDITSDDLKEIGVKIAHRKKILKAIQQKQLKNQQNILPSQPYEAGTAYI